MFLCLTSVRLGEGVNPPTDGSPRRRGGSPRYGHARLGELEERKKGTLWSA